jgi:hypothetical protein
MKRSRIYDEEAHSGAPPGVGFGKSRPSIRVDGRGAIDVASRAGCQRKALK